MISNWLRLLYLHLSYLTGFLRCFGPGMYARIPLFQRLSEPIRIIAAVSEQPVNLRQATYKRPCTDVIADLSGGDEQVEWSALAVADCVQLGVHAALGATNQASTPSFFAARLVAVRWALR